MGALKDILGFEHFNLKEMGRKLKKDPKRLLLGVDQGSTMVWNKVLGRDDEALVNWAGGPTGDVYDKAGAAGVKTKTAHKMHDFAEIIAGVIVGGKAMGAMNGGGAGGGAGSGGGSNVALSSGDKAALYGDAGYGQGMSGAETSAYDGAMGGSKIPWTKMGDMLQNMGQQQPQEDATEVHPSLVEIDQPNLVNEYARSSRKVKQAPRASMQSVMRRGAAGENPIDENGVQMAAIQALSKRIAKAKNRLAQLKESA